MKVCEIGIETAVTNHNAERKSREENDLAGARRAARARARGLPGWGRRLKNAITMFRVLPRASPPPFVVCRFGGEELLL